MRNGDLARLVASESWKFARVGGAVGHLVGRDKSGACARPTTIAMLLQIGVLLLAACPTPPKEDYKVLPYESQ